MKKNDILLIVAFAAVMAAVNLVLVWTNCLSWTGRWHWKAFGTMVAAAVTVAVMSQLYKDNPLFKLAEHMLVGSALGYGLVVVAWYSVWVNQIFPWLKPIGEYGLRALIHPIQVANEVTEVKMPLLGVWSVILPAMLGLLMYTRLSKKRAWLSRIPFAIMIGFGVGMAIPNDVTSKLLLQLKPMMSGLLFDTGGNFSLRTIHWNEIAILLGVLSTLFYFFFSVEHQGAAKVVAKTGIYFLMIAFGASFGYTVMGRLSLLIGRINYLFRDWIPLIP